MTNHRIDHCHISMTSGHVWKLTPTGRLQVLNGDPQACVIVIETQRGFQWVFKKETGYARTLGGAREYVEALAEHSTMEGPGNA